MSDETKKLQEEARRYWDKAVGYLKTVPGKFDETVRRTAETSVLRMEIVGQRRDLDQALRELGRRVYDLVKLQGEVSAEEISLAVERVTVHEDRIAEKERRIAELDAGAPPSESTTRGPAASEGAEAAPAKTAATPTAKGPGSRRKVAKTPAKKTARKATKRTVKKTAKKSSKAGGAKKAAKKTTKKSTRGSSGAGTTASKRSTTRKTTKR